MTDYIEDESVTPDEMFYCAQSERDGKWRLFDCGEESFCTDSMGEMRAFIRGLWCGMSTRGEVDLSCAFYSATGVLLDTMHSKH